MQHPPASSYRDYSQETNDTLLDIVLKDTQHAFPINLYKMLTETENKGMSHVISWQPHGRAFMIHGHKEFEHKILPSSLRMSQIASFKRQLHNYGFRRIKTGKDKGAFYHEYFLRERMFLCRRMVRMKQTKKGSTTDPPSFYDMKFLPPTSKHTLSVIPHATTSKKDSQLQQKTMGSCDHKRSSDNGRFSSDVHGRSGKEHSADRSSLSTIEETFLPVKPPPYVLGTISETRSNVFSQNRVPQHRTEGGAIIHTQQKPPGNSHILLAAVSSADSSNKGEEQSSDLEVAAAWALCNICRRYNHI